MPANLPPQYREAERRYREAKSPEEKVEALEEMMAILPKHKGTDKLKADIRRRISKHKDQAQKSKGSGRARTVYSIDKEGAAQVVIVGPPNTGKSSLVSLLTNAQPEVAPFPHTTFKPTPGMAAYENIQFQLVDTPPITDEYTDPLFADLLRRADMLVLMVDLSDDPLYQLDLILKTLAAFRIYPESAAVPPDLLKTPFKKNVLLVGNKMDSAREAEDFQTFLELADHKFPAIGISTKKGTNLMDLLKTIYELSRIIRVYTKSPGKEPDLTKPFVIPEGTTLEDFAGKIHKDFSEKLKYARVWGKAVHEGQMVQRDYLLQDGDIVELRI